MSPGAAIIGIAAGLMGDLLINAAGQVVGDTLFARYQQHMAGRGDNHDLQRAFVHACEHALSALHQRYLESGHPISAQERMLLEARCQGLCAEIKRMEGQLMSGADLLPYLSHIPASELERRLAAWVRSAYLDDAPPAFRNLVERDLADSVRFFLWEELKVNERAYRAFQQNILTAQYRDMQVLLDRIATSERAVIRRLDAVAPEAAELVRLGPPSPAGPLQLGGGSVAVMIEQLRSGDPAARERAARELLVLESDEAVAQLQELLRARQEDLRLYALLILARVRPEIVVPDLVGLASSGQRDRELQEYAARLLSDLRAPEAIQRLAGFLTLAEDAAELQAAYEALVALGPRAVAPLQAEAEQQVRAGNWEPARWALFALAQLAPAAALPGLRTLAERDPDPDIRAEAAQLADQLAGGPKRKGRA